MYHINPIFIVLVLKCESSFTLSSPIAVIVIIVVAKYSFF